MNKWDKIYIATLAVLLVGGLIVIVAGWSSSEEEHHAVETYFYDANGMILVAISGEGDYSGDYEKKVIVYDDGKSIIHNYPYQSEPEKTVSDFNEPHKGG